MLIRHSGEGRNPGQSHHWIPVSTGMTIPHVVITRFIRVIQFFILLGYRDKPGNDTSCNAGCAFVMEAR